MGYNIVIVTETLADQVANPVIMVSILHPKNHLLVYLVNVITTLIRPRKKCVNQKLVRIKVK